MQKILAHPLVMILLTGLTIMIVISLNRTAQKSKVSSENVRLIEQKNEQIRQQIDFQQQAIDEASTGLAKEKILRNELLLQKPGEYVLQIPDEMVINQQTGQLEQKTPLQEWQELVF